MASVEMKLSLFNLITQRKFVRETFKVPHFSDIKLFALAQEMILWTSKNYILLSYLSNSVWSISYFEKNAGVLQ